MSGSVIFFIMGYTGNKKPKLLFGSVSIADNTSFEFDNEINIEKIMAITDIHTNNVRRKKSLAYMAYFLTKSSCIMIADDGNIRDIDKIEKANPILFNNAVSNMYLLSDSMTVSIHASKFKMAEVEANALESIMLLCQHAV